MKEKTNNQAEDVVEPELKDVADKSHEEAKLESELKEKTDGDQIEEKYEVKREIEQQLPYFSKAATLLFAMVMMGIFYKFG